MKNLIIIDYNLRGIEYSKCLKSLRRQLLSVLDRLIIVCNTKINLSLSDLLFLRRMSSKLVDTFVHLLKHHRKFGFTKFKDMVNLVIHRILQGKADKNIKQYFRLPSYMKKI